MRSASSRTKRSAVAAPHGLALAVPAGAADDHDGADAGAGAERSNGLVDLQGQFPGWRQDQSPGLEWRRTPRLRHQMGQDRQSEGKGLAAAGLRDAQEVAALEQRRDGVDLDWGGSGEFVRRQCVQQAIGQAEAREVQTCHEG
jgi:hypothetical protein